MSTQARAEIVYVPTVDGLRGLAVVWIVLFHCLAAVGNLAPLDHGPLRKFQLSGYFGVDLLFIITGFVLFLPTVLDGGAVGDRRYFFKRRWARIVPAFWVATVLSYLVSRSLFRPKGGTGAWLSHLTFTHQFAHPVDEIGFGVNGAMWTMSVEVVFYLLLPWVAGWYFRHPFAGLALAVVSSHAWHTVTVNSAALLNWANVSWAGGKDAPYRMAYAPPSYIAHFALGMTGAWLYVKMREGPVERRTRSLASALALASFIGVLAIAVLRGWEQDDHPGGPFDMWVKTLDRTVLLAVLLVAMALASSRAQWVAGNGFSRLLGTVSYGTYLSHLPLILLLKQAFGIEYETKNNGDVYVLMATAVPLSIAVGVVSYTYLEEPFRRWARRRRTSTREPIARRRAALAGAQQW
jgi:peptidoglycan/LPS O-acetylase OafA/YrhL